MPTLHDNADSGNCYKVRLAMAQLGRPVTRIEYDTDRGETRTPAFLAKNPNGRVPVLEDGDLILWESTAIIRYLAAGSALAPTERRAAAEIDRWIAWQLAHRAQVEALALVELGFDHAGAQRRSRGIRNPGARRRQNVPADQHADEYPAGKHAGTERSVRQKH